MYCIFRALDYCKSKGIMHRDLKKENIIVNPYTKELRIIDWGLAEYFFEDEVYSVKVSTQYYKAPELLINY